MFSVLYIKVYVCGHWYCSYTSVNFYIGVTDSSVWANAHSGDISSDKKLGDTSLEGMLKAGNLAVHLLPYSSIKGIYNTIIFL